MGSESPAECCPPESEILLRTLAMPGDANPGGDIFGGWILAQMDIAGGVIAHQRARGRVATVAIEAMTFHKPVLVGDLVTCYGEVIRVGRTSLSVKLQTWVRRRGLDIKVTEGVFTFVALDHERRPRPVDPPGAEGAA